MAKVIALANLKGGTGKTNVAVNLGMFLSALGKKILLIDLSPRGDATFCLGIKDSSKFIGDVLQKKVKIGTAVKSTPYFGYDTIPSFSKLENTILKLQKIKGAEKRLKQAIEKEQEEYDFILIDTAPAFDILIKNALYCADRLIIPVQCEYLSLKSAREFTKLIDSLKGLSFKNPEILLTMYVWRSRLSRNIAKLAREEFVGNVFSAVIPKAVILAEEEQRKEPVLKSFPSSRAARAFRQLAEEVIEK